MGRGGGGRPGAAPQQCGWARPSRAGWPYPLCRVRGREQAGAGAPCAPREHPDYIYQRVVSPHAPTTPSPITQSGQSGASRKGKSDISPPHCPCPGSGPLHPDLPGGSNPRTPARPRRIRPSEARSGPGCAPRNHRGALAMRRAPHPTITLRIHPGQRGAAVSRAAGPGARGDAGTANPPHRPAPPRSAAPDRPAGSHRRHRRQPEPPPRGAPHPTDRPVPTPAFAARLNPHPVGRRARATAPATPSPLPSPPVLTFAPRDAAPDRPAGPPPAVTASLNPHLVRCRARPTGRSPPGSRRRRRRDHRKRGGRAPIAVLGSVPRTRPRPDRSGGMRCTTTPVPAPVRSPR